MRLIKVPQARILEIFDKRKFYIAGIVAYSWLNQQWEYIEFTS